MTWEQYERWNSAIASEIFSTEQSGLPAYLDLEDDVLAGVAARAESTAEDPGAELVAAVRGTLAVGGVRAKIFASHNQRLRDWEGKPTADPPHLALLAVFSLAAERMARGDGFSSQNYYGRLAPMLGMESRVNDLAHAYRSHAERWWAALNGWLERHDGRRGLPTAFTLTGTNQRFVGLAISQALIRTADRQNLVRFFRRVGFAPGTDVTPSTLVPLLDAWIGQQPSPATRSLQRIWSKPATRPRVAEVAAVALASWDGAVEGGAVGALGSDENLRLFATLGGFFKQQLDLGVLAYLEKPHVLRDVRVVDVDGDPLITAVPTSVGAMRLAGVEQADLASLLDGALTIEDSLTGRRTTRRPRRVVPLRMDDLLQQLIETDQVQAGADLVVLLKRELVRVLSELLAEVARPGWSIIEQLNGLPAGWALARDVQILRASAQLPALDLRGLLPLTQSQLTMAGGFAIPGRIRRWHSWMPPEIRAIDDSGLSTIVRVIRVGAMDDAGTEHPEHDVVLNRTNESGHVTMIDVSSLELGDGDYRVELYRQGDESPLTSQMLRLRSGNMRDVLQWELAPALGHTASTPLSALAAVAVDDQGVWIRGAVVTGNTASSVVQLSFAASPWWESSARRLPTQPSERWRVAAADPSSCMFTGAHYIVVPEAGPGRPLTKFIDGTCRDCGLVRRLPTSAWAARKRAPRESGGISPRTLDVTKIEPIRAKAQDRRWEVGLDTLQYLGGGDYGLLERAALQIEGSGLVVDTFIRTLEGLGHIEVSRSDDLRGEQWEIAPTALAQRSDGDWSLVGYWPESTLLDVQASFRAVDGEVYVVRTEQGLPLYFADTAAGVFPSLDHVDGLSIVPCASEGIAAQLRPLSELVAALPRRSAAIVGQVRKFEPVGARWEPTAGIAGPGAYRVRRWSEIDIVRTEADVAHGTVARSTVQLSKHVAALAYGRPLVAYSPDTTELVVPLGADLPGVFGRAAIVASGQPPTVDNGARRLIYHSVPPDVAAMIIRCLGS